ncbi:MAG: CHAT domain protein [Syntrophorhabdus sp. PtaB.Bin006]|nr:MAG: CHAT domain protein [Syntrophorhabdus sp. PtaB.Bin006]
MGIYKLHKQRKKGGSRSRHGKSSRQPINEAYENEAQHMSEATNDGCRPGRSWAHQIHFSCPGCGFALTLKAWVLVDVDERPDLVGQIGRGTLHAVTCAQCGKSTQVDVPMLLFRADASPPLLFSPSRQTSQERESLQLRELLFRLQGQEETRWVNEFTFGIQGVKRDRLAAVLGVDLRAILLDLARWEKAGEWERVAALAEKALGILRREEDPAMWTVIREGWAGAHSELAVQYIEQPRGEKADNIERAIYHGRQALTVFTEEKSPDLWAIVHHNLAIAYLNRIVENREDNLKEAAVHHRMALQVYTIDSHPKDWAIEMEGLANLCCEGSGRDRPGLLEEAIRGFELALQVHTPTAMPREYARTMNNLALAYCARVEGDGEQNLHHAVDCLTDALKVADRKTYPEEWAATHGNLTKAYEALYRIVEGGPSLEKAIFHCRQALEVFTVERFPARYRQCRRTLALLYFYTGDWKEAHTACTDAIEADRILLSAAYTEFGRRAEVAETRNIYQIDAYCLLKLKQADEALPRLEQGKTQLLNESLSLSELDLLALSEAQQSSVRKARETLHEIETSGRLGQGMTVPVVEIERAEALRQARRHLNSIVENIRAENPAFMPHGLDLPVLLSLAPGGGALVMPCITPQGSIVFVVPHGVSGITEKEHCVPLDSFTDKDETVLLFGPMVGKKGPESSIGKSGGWMPAYLNRSADPGKWLDTIEHTGHELWKSVFEPVHKRLAALGIAEGAPLLLIVPGGLNLLPLHAAWREVDGRKRYVLDDYTVSYGPSCYACHVSRCRLQRPNSQKSTMLAVMNPTDDLVFASSEGAAIGALFGKDACRLLAGKEATSDTFMRSTHGATYLHFACHGYYDWKNPMNSGLLLAEREPLTLARILTEPDLGATRLVVLSACETGLTDISESPDEYLGLPASFLQAGAPGVLSTLWPVDDLSTMLLMEHFYEGHIHGGFTPAESLRGAQLWLRDLSADVLRRRLSEMRKQLGPDHPSASTVGRQFRRFAEMEPEERPFAHPYYWAGFTFAGM